MTVAPVVQHLCIAGDEELRVPLHATALVSAPPVEPRIGIPLDGFLAILPPTAYTVAILRLPCEEWQGTCGPDARQTDKDDANNVKDA